MALFDLRKYILKFDIEKPNNKWEYFYGDKIKGKVIMTIRKPFHSKALTLRLVRKSKITTRSKIDNKKTVNTKQEFLYNDVLQGPDHNLPNKDFSPKDLTWDFQIKIPKFEEQKDYTLMKRFFDAFYPVEIENKYSLELIIDLPWPFKPEKLTKNIKVIDKM